MNALHVSPAWCCWVFWAPSDETEPVLRGCSVGLHVLRRPCCSQKTKQALNNSLSWRWSVRAEMHFDCSDGSVALMFKHSELAAADHEDSVLLNRRESLCSAGFIRVCVTRLHTVRRSCDWSVWASCSWPWFRTAEDSWASINKDHLPFYMVASRPVCLGENRVSQALSWKTFSRSRQFMKRLHFG